MMTAMTWVAEGTRRLRSALLIDAENMYTGLSALSPTAASEFVNSPQRWMSWLNQLTYPQVTGIAHRDVLVRNCYLNPSTGGNVWRSAFIQAGFQVIDCPTLTSAGKNSADIHMVIAMLDLLAHPTHFDEIIVMSSDADFTPALARIRAHDRRSVVVASGPYAPVLPASCDFLVPAAVFIHEALANPTRADARRPAPIPAAAPGSDSAAVEVTKTQKKTAAKKTVAKKSPAAKTIAKAAAGGLAAAKTTAAKKVPPTKKPAKKAAAPKAPLLPTDLRARASKTVTEMIHASPSPVVLASLATPVRDALGPDLASTWDGANSLKKLLQQLNLPGFKLSEGTPGYLYDPARHEPPSAADT